MNRTWIPVIANIRRLKREVRTLYRCFKHPETPWYAKLGFLLAVAYAVSPVDLVSDFIVGIGWLDDLIIVPALLWASKRLIGKDIVKDCEGHNKPSRISQ